MGVAIGGQVGAGQVREPGVAEDAACSQRDLTALQAQHLAERRFRYQLAGFFFGEYRSFVDIEPHIQANPDQRSADQKR